MKTKYAVLSSLFFIIQLVGVLPLRAEHYYFKQISLKEGKHSINSPFHSKNVILLL